MELFHRFPNYRATLESFAALPSTLVNVQKLVRYAPLVAAIQSGCAPDTGCQDRDGDGYYVGSSCQSSLEMEGGEQDLNPNSYPGAVEICDQEDNDSDGQIDEEAVDTFTWYRDADGDGYGSPNDTRLACEQPQGYVGTGTDCNDADTLFHPYAAELCDGADNDCDGIDDENPDCASDTATTL